MPLCTAVWEAGFGMQREKWWVGGISSMNFLTDSPDKSMTGIEREEGKYASGSFYST